MQIENLMRRRRKKRRCKLGAVKSGPRKGKCKQHR